jgi:hypothetical protein
MSSSSIRALNRGIMMTKKTALTVFNQNQQLYAKKKLQHFSFKVFLRVRARFKNSRFLSLYTSLLEMLYTAPFKT